MRIIKDLSDDIRHNIEQAREHINTAYRLRETNRQAADWYKDMALSHLNYNTAGHAVVKKLIDDRKASGGSDLIPGMLAVYNAVHADLIKDAAEVKYLIDQYAK